MDPYLGEIQIFAGNFAPRGWAFCDGQLLSISQYEALYSLLGTMYGGDGRSTFALPDLRGRAPRGMGTGPGLSPVTQGERAGAETHTLTAAQMPGHSHGLGPNGADEAGDQSSPGGHNLAQIESGYTGSAADVTVGPPTTLPAGSGAAFNIEDPYLGMNYIIALQGVYPSRS
ncbi:MAG: tail fiber protein [Pseudomonadota bacterium]